MQKQDVVCLDVGGKLFRTTWQTLRSQPNSYFHELHDSGDETIFIDRNPALFSEILDMLRNDCNQPQLPSDPVTLHRLRIETDFYQLTVLSVAIEQKLNEINSSGSSVRLRFEEQISVFVPMTASGKFSRKFEKVLARMTPQKSNREQPKERKERTISLPTNVRHVAHIGMFDDNFECIGTSQKCSTSSEASS